MAHSHKRETHARRKIKAALVAGPLTVLATGAAVDRRRDGTPPGIGP